jgi:hypothetical protein
MAQGHAVAPEFNFPDQKSVVDKGTEDIFNLIFPDGNPNEPAPQAQPKTQKPQEPQPPRQPDVNEFDKFKPQETKGDPSVSEDPPNAQIRIDKMREQRDEARTNENAMRERIAKLEGITETMQKTQEQSAEPEPDPTEYMSDTELILHNQQKTILDNMAKLSAAVTGINTTQKEDQISKEEDNFFKSNPELKDEKKEVTDSILDYLKDKPEIKKMLLSKQISLNEIYGMVTAKNPPSQVRTEVVKPAGFSGQTGSGSPASVDVEDSQKGVKSALNVLRNPDSFNKKDATEFLLGNIADDILKSM